MPEATKKPARIASAARTQIVAPKHVIIQSGHKGGFVAWSAYGNSRRISEGPTYDSAVFNAAKRGYSVKS